MRTFINLSLPIQATPSEFTPVKLSVLAHHEAPWVLGLEPEDFPDGLAISNEQVCLSLSHCSGRAVAALGISYK